MERATRIAAAEASAAGVRAGSSHRWWTSPVTRAGAGSPRGRAKIPTSGPRWCVRVPCMSRAPTSAPRIASSPARTLGSPTARWRRDASTTPRTSQSGPCVRSPLSTVSRGLDAGVGSFMTALNTVDGIPATANPFTLGRVLRGEWRFDGLVVSDYNAVKQLVTHGLAADDGEAARLALLAGIDMEEESTLFRAHGAKAGRRRQGPRGPGSTRPSGASSGSSTAWASSIAPTPIQVREREVLLSREHLAAARAPPPGVPLVLLKNEGGVLPLCAGGPPVDRDPRAAGRRPGDPARPPARPTARRRTWSPCWPASSARVAERGGATRVALCQACAVDGDAADGIAEAVRLARAVEGGTLSPWASRPP